MLAYMLGGLEMKDKSRLERIVDIHNQKMSEVKFIVNGDKEYHVICADGNEVKDLRLYVKWK